jgi:hypothetical protein
MSNRNALPPQWVDEKDAVVELMEEMRMRMAVRSTLPHLLRQAVLSLSLACMGVWVGGRVGGCACTPACVEVNRQLSL